MQMVTSIFGRSATALGRAVEHYMPESVSEYAGQVEALAKVLQAVSSAVTVLRERGQVELPIDRSVLAHLARVVEQLDVAVAVAAEGGPLLEQLLIEEVRRLRPPPRREDGEAA